ncbi:hypothetical protein [Salibacterium lacus]|uniref:Uncharacterized protein n=1 Tax=Salibacterium lacus TaxID=1898109 RepID=A0ABW5SWK2_9BACI
MANRIKKSIRMVNYALSSLESKRIIKRIPVMRPQKGGNSSNVIVILPYYCTPKIADGDEETKGDTIQPESTKYQSETTVLKSKQEKYICDSDRLFRLFELKMKDKSVQYGSAYMQKVTDTLLNEYEKVERQQEYAQIQTPKEELPTYPNVNWLEEPIYTPDTFDPSNVQHRMEFWDYFLES